MDTEDRIRCLVDQFAASVIAQDEARTATEGNRHAKQRIRAFKELAAIGDCGRDGLVRLFEHPYPRIRCMAAVYLLRHKHKEAMAVLEELASGDGLVAFAAEQSIKNWYSGDWELDPRPSAE